MAGSMVSVNQELGVEAMAMSAIVDQWEVQYARFFLLPPPPAVVPHPQLVPQAPLQRKIKRGGVWISTSSAVAGGASLKIIAGSSSDYVLNLSLRGTVLEEHRISELHFTWPQVSCISGFPARGTRAVIVSFKDAPDQVQRFALRFLTTDEAECFISLLKIIMGARGESGDEEAKSYSEISSQSKYMPSVQLEPLYRSEDSLRNTISADTSNCEGLQSFSCEDNSVNPVMMEGIQDGEPQEYHPVFPPSFSSFLKDCCPEPEKEQPSVIQEVEQLELKSEVMKYLEDDSFQDLMVKMENIISQL